MKFIFFNFKFYFLFFILKNKPHVICTKIISFVLNILKKNKLNLNKTMSNVFKKKRDLSFLFQKIFIFFIKKNKNLFRYLLSIFPNFFIQLLSFFIKNEYQLPEILIDLQFSILNHSKTAFYFFSQNLIFFHKILFFSVIINFFKIRLFLKILVEFLNLYFQLYKNNLLKNKYLFFTKIYFFLLKLNKINIYFLTKVIKCYIKTYDSSILRDFLNFFNLYYVFLFLNTRFTNFCQKIKLSLYLMKYFFLFFYLSESYRNFLLYVFFYFFGDLKLITLLKKKITMFTIQNLEKTVSFFYKKCIVRKQYFLHFKIKNKNLYNLTFIKKIYFLLENSKKNFNFLKNSKKNTTKTKIKKRIFVSILCVFLFSQLILKKIKTKILKPTWIFFPNMVKLMKIKLNNFVEYYKKTNVYTQFIKKKTKKKCSLIFKYRFYKKNFLKHIPSFFNHFFSCVYILFNFYKIFLAKNEKTKKVGINVYFKYDNRTNLCSYIQILKKKCQIIDYNINKKIKNFVQKDKNSKFSILNKNFFTFFQKNKKIKSLRTLTLTLFLKFIFFKKKNTRNFNILFKFIKKTLNFKKKKTFFFSLKCCFFCFLLLNKKKTNFNKNHTTKEIGECFVKFFVFSSKKITSLKPLFMNLLWPINNLIKNKKVLKIFSYYKKIFRINEIYEYYFFNSISYFYTNFIYQISKLCYIIKIYKNVIYFYNIFKFKKESFFEFKFHLEKINFKLNYSLFSLNITYFYYLTFFYYLFIPIKFRFIFENLYNYFFFFYFFKKVEIKKFKFFNLCIKSYNYMYKKRLNNYFNKKCDFRKIYIRLFNSSSKDKKHIHVKNKKLLLSIFMCFGVNYSTKTSLTYTKELNLINITGDLILFNPSNKINFDILILEKHIKINFFFLKFLIKTRTYFYLFIFNKRIMNLFIKKNNYIFFGQKKYNYNIKNYKKQTNSGNLNGLNIISGYFYLKYIFIKKKNHKIELNFSYFIFIKILPNIIVKWICILNRFYLKFFCKIFFYIYYVVFGWFDYLKLNFYIKSKTKLTVNVYFILKKNTQFLKHFFLNNISLLKDYVMRKKTWLNFFCHIITNFNSIVCLKHNLLIFHTYFIFRYIKPKFLYQILSMISVNQKNFIIKKKIFNLIFKHLLWKKKTLNDYFLYKLKNSLISLSDKIKITFFSKMICYLSFICTMFRFFYNNIKKLNHRQLFKNIYVFSKNYKYTIKKEIMSMFLYIFLICIKNKTIKFYIKWNFVFLFLDFFKKIKRCLFKKNTTYDIFLYLFNKCFLFFRFKKHIIHVITKLFFLKNKIKIKFLFYFLKKNKNLIIFFLNYISFFFLRSFFLRIKSIYNAIIIKYLSTTGNSIFCFYFICQLYFLFKNKIIIVQFNILFLILKTLINIKNTWKKHCNKKTSYCLFIVIKRQYEVFFTKISCNLVTLIQLNGIKKQLRYKIKVIQNNFFILNNLYCTFKSKFKNWVEIFEKKISIVIIIKTHIIYSIICQQFFIYTNIYIKDIFVTITTICVKKRIKFDISMCITTTFCIFLFNIIFIKLNHNKKLKLKIFYFLIMFIFIFEIKINFIKFIFISKININIIKKTKYNFYKHLHKIYTKVHLV